MSLAQPTASPSSVPRVITPAALAPKSWAREAECRRSGHTVSGSTSLRVRTRGVIGPQPPAPLFFPSKPARSHLLGINGVWKHDRPFSLLESQSWSQFGPAGLLQWIGLSRSALDLDDTPSAFPRTTPCSWYRPGRAAIGSDRS